MSQREDWGWGWGWERTLPVLTVLVWFLEPTSGDSANTQFQGSDSLWPLWTHLYTVYTNANNFFKTEKKEDSTMNRNDEILRRDRQGLEALGLESSAG